MILCPPSTTLFTWNVWCTLRYKSSKYPSEEMESLGFGNKLKPSHKQTEVMETIGTGFAWSYWVWGQVMTQQYVTDGDTSNLLYLKLNSELIIMQCDRSANDHYNGNHVEILIFNVSDKHVVYLKFI